MAEKKKKKTRHSKAVASAVAAVTAAGVMVGGWARMSMSPTEKVHQASKRCPSPGDFCSAISHLGGKLLQIFTAPLALCRLLLFLTRNIPYHF